MHPQAHHVVPEDVSPQHTSSSEVASQRCDTPAPPVPLGTRRDQSLGVRRNSVIHTEAIVHANCS